MEELTEELRQTEKSAYEKLIRQMSHEVNNTVGATRSLLQSSLAYGEGLPAARQTDMREALGIAGDRLERLNTFMRGFADVVRMPQPVKRPTDVLRLLDACVRLVRAQTDSSRVAWRWEPEGEPGIVDMDEAQMEQALINILKNAVEALPADGGSVTIRAGSSAGGGYVEVEDTGPGISTKMIAETPDTFYYDQLPPVNQETRLYYVITAFDNQGNQSYPSEEINVLITGLGEHPPKGYDGYRLLANYPNPFNPSTKIPYRLKAGGYVKLYVYDLKGELVKVLVNQWQEKGFYEVVFYPTLEERGKVTSLEVPMGKRYKQMSSGIYLYMIQVYDELNIPVFSDAEKMILLK